MSGKYFIIGGAVLIIALIAVLSLVNVFGTGTQSGVAGTTTNNLGASNPAGTGTAATTGSTANTGTATEVQDVNLKVVGGTYVLDPSVLKKGIPVRMTVDLGSVVGCSRDIVIQSFGVRKYVKPGDNIIEFTPDKTGTINIACSMNMYKGTFQVTDDGKPSASLQTLSPASTQAGTSASSGGSCGAGSGGCGCGMMQ